MQDHSDNEELFNMTMLYFSKKKDITNNTMHHNKHVTRNKHKRTIKKYKKRMRQLITHLLIEKDDDVSNDSNLFISESLIHKFFEFANEAVAHFKLTDQSARLQSEYSTSPPLIPSNLDDDEMDEQLKNATNAMFSISNDDHDTNFQTNSKMFFIPKCRNINTSQKKKIVATY